MRGSEDFDRFYLASRDRLVVQLTAFAGDPTDAQDLVQEAFERAWVRWDRVGGYEDPEGWVRRIAFNLAVSRWRRTRRVLTGRRAAVELSERSASADDPTAMSDEHLVLWAALERLPDAERRAVVLHYLADRSVEQIAAETGAAVGTVKSWLHRGRRRLADALEGGRDG